MKILTQVTTWKQSPTYHVHMLNYSLLLLLSISLSACSLFETNKEQNLSFKAHSKVYKASYEETWQATQKALSKYRLELSNIDKGLLKTEVIKGAKAWRSPTRKRPYSAGYSSQLKIRVIKGRIGKKPTVKVVIKKNVELQKDFFSQKKPLPSDGLEEKMILYRIKREIIINRGLDKAYEKMG